MRRICLSIVCVLIICSQAGADAGTEGASFLNIPVGGRPAALGGAYSALAKDAYAPIYNPAGMGFLKGPQLAAMHLSQTQSINYEFVSFVAPFGTDKTSGMGASFQYLRPGDIEGTDAVGNPIDSFSGSFMAASVGAGHAFSKQFSFGAMGKLIQEKIAGISAHSYAGDAGAMFRVNRAATLSAGITNAGSDLKFINEGDPLPTAYVLGGSWTPVREWALALQGTSSRNGLKRGQAGVEWNPVEMLSLRVGYRTDTRKELSDTAGFTAGVGFHLAGQQFDYAVVSSGDLGYTQYFSAVFQGGGPPQDEDEDDPAATRRKNDSAELNYMPREKMPSETHRESLHP